MVGKNQTQESVQRFSPRAGEYSQHRPDYPSEALDYLEDQGLVGIGTEVADVGAGTGIFSEQLLGKGCRVWAVEPNAAMRSIAETRFESRNMFNSVPADAADTRLDDESVELVTAAQAFHWFDVGGARAEFRRILQPPKHVALLWNIRDVDATPFTRELEETIATHGIDYEDVYDTYDSYVASLDSFFDGSNDQEGYTHRTFEHTQPVDRQGLLGLVTSFSYMPRPSDDGFDEMIGDLQKLFDTHAEEGKVVIRYNTELFVGTIE